MNPIRKVVTMLQSMQKKVEEEGEKEKGLYEKFMCYCQSGNSDLSASISAAELKVPAVSSDIEASEAKLAQAKEDLKQAQADRAAAKQAMAEATALREKEASEFAAEKAEYDANIGAMDKAVAALEKGMAGGFLQTDAAQVLRRLALGKQDLLDADRQELLAFLSGGGASGYAPQSGEITGILKEMSAEMKKSLADATAQEEESIKSYEALVAAKTKEVAALTTSIESKTQQVGELGVSIVQKQQDLDDTEAALLADQKYLKELDSSCKTKTSEWEERSKTRAEELVAIADTIKILNDDDALDLFKKTLPSAGSSFVQMEKTASKIRDRALDVIATAKRASVSQDHVSLDLITLALSGKRSAGQFDKVVKMIDNMLDVLKKEQSDDDDKKEYCGIQLDSADDRKKGLEHTITEAENAIESSTDAIATLTEELAALEKGIKALDKSVMEASEQRKEEHAEYQQLLASNHAAKQLLAFAKNRLNKFYNPKLYKPAAKKELSSEERIFTNMGGTPPPTEALLAQVAVHRQRVHKRDAPAPPPETWGAYATKGQETSGVIAMLDLLIRDLDKEITEAETEEKNSQKDYEAMMSESAAKRAADSKTLAEKGRTKADVAADLEAHKESKAASGTELMATLKYIKSLHAECDWLIQYYDVRKEARAAEADNLAKAKAVLNGADYALLQKAARLRGAHLL